MRFVLKNRWVLMAVWAVGIVLLVWTAPNMGELVREKGQISVPDGYPSTVAEDILAEADPNGKGSASQVALVFHDPGGLDDAEMAAIEKAVDQLERNKESLGIDSVTTHFDEKELEDRLVSKDGKTVLTALDVKVGDRDPQEVRDALYAEIEGTPVDHYFTSSWMIAEDVVKSSEEGLKRTEAITVVFILLVLVVVFRSLIAPFIPLVAVGVSYITSQSIVAFLVEWVNFPLSTFTQIFLVAVLFGIGTDYCILLLSRFKEELAHHEELFPAIAETYRTAGKTVFFSGLAVLAGFAAIGLSTFNLYQSASAVAIGVAVLLLALMTVVPFFMAMLGKRLFWPSKRAIEHRDSKLWDRAGQFSLARPLVTLLVVAAIVIPFIVTYDGDLSYNSLDEIGDGYDSVKAFNIIADSFGPGESLPAKVVIQNGERLDTSGGLAAIEQVSREVEKIDGVKSVRSATRPVGDELEELQVANQADTLGEGLGEGNRGLGQIRDGLQEASTSLSHSAPEIQQAADGVGELIAATDELKSGVSQLGEGLEQLERGLRDGSMGAGELKKGLQQAKDSAQQLADGSRDLLDGYRTAEKGLQGILEHYREIEAQLPLMSASLNGVSQNLENLAASDTLTSDDKNLLLSALGTVKGLQQGIGELEDGIKELNDHLTQVRGGLKEANAALTQVSGGQRALSGGLDELAQGIAELQEGIEQAADGQREINSELPAMSSGLEQMIGGQRELQDGFEELDSQLAALTRGLDQSAEGLNDISDGLRSAQSYLGDLSNTAEGDLSGWFIPEDVLENDDFQQVFDVYMSPDRKVTTLDVVFNANPYSTQAMDKVDEIEEAVQRATRGTELENATVAVSGVSSMNNDLSAISDQDYTRTAVLMLLSIAVILIVLLRSVVMPVYLIASLILTYYTSMGIAEFVFVDLIGYPGLSWAVPFFGFVILIALGVDYSIFLMHRFNEYKDWDVQEGIRMAMRKMGTVIISAVIILGGTFAAMLPSGVLSILQIATVTISGLLLYACLVLPLFVPVMVRTFGKANWWPFG